MAIEKRYSSGQKTTTLTMLRTVATFLIEPVHCIWIGVLGLFFVKGCKKRYFVALNLFFYFLTVPLTSHVFNRTWRIEDTFDCSMAYDAVVVLLGVSDSGWYLKNKMASFDATNYYRFNNAADRVLTGVDLVKEGCAKMMLIGDYVVDSFSESDMIKAFAFRHGLRADQIQIYGSIKNTGDEAKGVLAYTKAQAVGRILLITSQLHMRRALATFRRCGLTPETYSVNKKSQRMRWRLFLPGMGGVSGSRASLYELVGYVWYRMKGDL